MLIVLATITLVLPNYTPRIWFSVSAREMVLLAMTILISMLTPDNGRANILFGLVHVVVFAVFLFMAFVP